MNAYLGESENGDSLERGPTPSGQMKVMREALDGFGAPLETGGEKPSESEDDPPDRRSHSEEVQHHEEDCTSFLLRSLDDHLHLE